MYETTNGVGSGPEVPILGQIYQLLNTIDKKLDLLADILGRHPDMLVSLGQRVLALNAASATYSADTSPPVTTAASPAMNMHPST
ncbi:hypothetical protein GGH92_009612, partial [Coemansia sp. RSA 2673]